MVDSPIEQILLYLYDCIDSGFSYTAKRKLYMDDLFASSNWNFSKDKFEKSFKNLKRLKLVTQREKNNGPSAILLSEKGKLRALNTKFKLIDRKKGEWDKKWRLVAFDIPNSHRNARRALRYRLKTAGFKEMQESAFIHPRDCEQEVRAFIKMFRLEKYVRFGLLDYIDGQEYFVKTFKLE